MLKKLTKNTSIYLFLFLILFNFNIALSDVVYPEYTGEKVVDLSGKFDNRYSNNLSNELKQSDNDIRVVFLNTKGKINLSFYAPKLFDKWKMDQNSILVVIDPYLNKTGYGLGKKVLEDMKKRQSAKSKDKKNEPNNEIIDYDNLASAINDKFSPDQIKEDDEENFTNNTSNDLNSIGKKSLSKTKKNKKSNLNFDVLKIVGIIIILGLIGFGLWYLYNKNKRLKELNEAKSNYLFDLNIQKKEILSLIEELYFDIDKMNIYEEIDESIEFHIEELNILIDKGELFLEKNDLELDELNLDELDEEELDIIKEMINKSTIIKGSLRDVHNDSIEMRKNLNSILEKNDRDISYMRNELKISKSNLDELKINYNLNLSILDEKIKRLEKNIKKINILLIEDNHIEAVELTDQIRNNINKIKDSIDNIPSLYRQITEKIPYSIDKNIVAGVSDPDIKEKMKKEINELKNLALLNLSNGDFDKSEKIIKDIYLSINEIKSKVKSRLI